jgi:hypothetical protein
MTPLEGSVVALRRIISLVILGAFLALAVLSFLGDRVLSVVFIVVAGGVLAHHAVRLCPACSNRACAFNPRFDADAGDESFSDLPITRTTVLPLLATGPLAFIAAWRASPPAAIAVGVVALSAHHAFRKATCSRCGNDCLGNCNERYRCWKRGKAQGRG